LEGSVQPRRTDRLARCRSRNAKPAQQSCRSGVLKDRLKLGSLRRAFCRAHRGATM